jgi:hypothetical protein
VKSEINEILKRIRIPLSSSKQEEAIILLAYLLEKHTYGDACEVGVSGSGDYNAILLQKEEVDEILDHLSLIIEDPEFAFCPELLWAIGKAPGARSLRAIIDFLDSRDSEFDENLLYQALISIENSLDCLVNELDAYSKTSMKRILSIVLFDPSAWSERLRDVSARLSKRLS